MTLLLRRSQYRGGLTIEITLVLRSVSVSRWSNYWDYFSVETFSVSRWSNLL